FMSAHDFNLIRQNEGFCGEFAAREALHACWTVDLRSADGVPPAAGFSNLCTPVLGRTPRARFLVPRPVSVHGLRSIDGSRELARCRDLPASSVAQAVSRRI